MKSVVSCHFKNKIWEEKVNDRASVLFKRVVSPKVRGSMCKSCVSAGYVTFMHRSFIFGYLGAESVNCSDYSVYVFV